MGNKSAWLALSGCGPDSAGRNLATQVFSGGYARENVWRWPGLAARVIS